MGDRKMCIQRTKEEQTRGLTPCCFCGGILRDVFECGDLEDGSAVGIHWARTRASVTLLWLLFHSSPSTEKENKNKKCVEAMRRVVYVIRQISCFYLCVCFLLLLSNHHTNISTTTPPSAGRFKRIYSIQLGTVNWKC